MGERGTDVLVVRCVILTLDGEDLDAVVCHQVRRDVVLRGQRIGRAEHDVRAPRLQGDHQIGGLAGDVEARRESLRPASGLFPREPLPKKPQDGHGTLGPLGPTAPLVGQRRVLDVRLLGGSRGGRRHAETLDE